MCLQLLYFQKLCFQDLSSLAFLRQEVSCKLSRKTPTFQIQVANHTSNYILTPLVKKYVKELCSYMDYHLMQLYEFLAYN